eukprot:CAMPEP_0171554254 /NCGR_PEP_ID=MMETSP0960-20121227/9423_1 /TAXON_ID=87120 /ORGANISM="Aurantiochytrium limacinum, Strain ATCCMYA-1381" /LENGTH=182 /DNA_ID=CAMNT_0012104091 /DNA_START=67 /DNA_END=615 /DNA_ORIENTATION=-
MPHGPMDSDEFLFQKELVSGVIDTHVQQIWCHALMASRRRSNAQSKVTPHIPGIHPSAARVHAYIHTSYTPSTIQFLAAPKTSVVLFIYRHRVLPSSRARLIAKSRKNPLLAIFASLSLFESSRVEWSGVEWSGVFLGRGKEDSISSSNNNKAAEAAAAADSETNAGRGEEEAERGDRPRLS